MKTSIKNLMNTKSLTAISMLLLMALMLMTILPAVNAVFISTEPRKTSAQISVKPTVIGKGQQLTVNMFVWPPPEAPDYYARGSEVQNMYYEGVTVTFTRPDGSKDTFMPVNPSLAIAGDSTPGRTEATGGLYFWYYPNQVGTWSISFSHPGTTFYLSYDPTVGVFYEAATSKTITFTVTEEKQTGGLLDGSPYSPLPTGYWTSPVSPNNREWSEISGPWLQTGHDATISNFNPYSTGPETAHIAWKEAYAMGGIVGGDWGATGFKGMAPGNFIIMSGRLFYNDQAGGTFSCRDLRTGELIYRATGSVTVGQNLLADVEYAPGVPRVSTGSVTAWLWGFIGTTWRRYDPSTGALLQTISNAPAGIEARSFSDGDFNVYVAYVGGWNTTRLNGYAYSNLIKWDWLKVTGNDWRTGIVWNVSTIQPDDTSIADNTRTFEIHRFDLAGVLVCTARMEPNFMAFDMETGEHLYTKYTGIINVRARDAGPSGPFVIGDAATVTVTAFDVRTGNKVWVSDSLWGTEWVPAFREFAWAYDTMYVGSYDDHLVAVDAKTGKIKWQSEFIGDPTGEVVWPGTTFADTLVVADGKLYWSTSNQRDQRPTPRFTEMIAQDAFTGKTLWRVGGSYEKASIAEGYLIAGNQFDGCVYSFGKGKTETAVSIQNNVIAKGASTLIEGTVMDMSPAQPNTPAVAKESMSEWMNYLHMQNATLINNPPTPKGVPVLLKAVDSNGNAIDLGSVTTNLYGQFSTVWTPPNIDKYTIAAYFAGDDSYWSSSAATALATTAAPTTTENGAGQPVAAADNTLIIVGTGIAVIIAVAVATVLILRKKQ